MNDNSIFFKIFSESLKENIHEIGENILVGFSGGPDSTALLLGLKNFFTHGTKKIFALHLNHSIEKNADLFEEKSREICKKLSLEFISLKIDIPEIAKKEKISIELAGRNERYNFFSYMAKKLNSNIVFVGHTMDDQAETVIHNSIRGSGILGISGMKKISKNNSIKIFRPMLGIRKFQCINYCDINNINPIIDFSNRKKIYTRNKIRLDVVPELMKISNKSIENIFKLTKNLESEIKILDWVTEKFYKKIITTKKNIFKRDILYSLPIDLTAKIIMKIWSENYSHKGSLGNRHIKKISNLLYGNSGKKINLPGKIILYIDKDKFVFSDEFNILKKEEITSNKFTKFKYPKLKKMSIMNFPNINYSLSAEIKKYPNIFPNYDQMAIYVSTDISLNLIKLRTIAENDVFRPLGMDKEVNAYNFLRSQNLPKRHRQKTIVLENENGILWIIGLRIAEWAKVNNSDSHAIKLILSKLK
ncbi:MAG: tRNA lysidine(34) synthetase TilS [Chloroflexi bacterium]|nr:tRNA lysidine(34) synthetase TilS [Chloroflexota bacterium]